MALFNRIGIKSPFIDLLGAVGQGHKDFNDGGRI